MPLPALPVWATSTDAIISTPLTAKQQQGWTTSTGTPEGVGEKPPLEYFNWLANQTYLCLQAIYAVIGSTTSLGTMASQNANAVAITGGTISGTNINTVLAALGTMSTQNANAVAITGGSISGTSISGAFTGSTINSSVIGGTTPAAGTFTVAKDSGAAPTTNNQLTNKLYVDGSIVTNSNGTAVTATNGIITQYMTVSVSGGAQNITQAATFPIPFPNAILSIQVNGPSANAGYGAIWNTSDTTGSVDLPTLTGLVISGKTNATGGLFNDGPYLVYVTAVGK